MLLKNFKTTSSRRLVIFKRYFSKAKGIFPPQNGKKQLPGFEQFKVFFAAENDNFSLIIPLGWSASLVEMMIWCLNFDTKNADFWR